MKKTSEKTIQAFNLVKQLQDKVPRKTIAEIAGVSVVTVKRIIGANSLEQYKLNLRKENEKYLSHKKKDVVLKNGPNPDYVEKFEPKYVVKGDFSEIKETTALSLLNSILKEMKLINENLVEIYNKKRSLF